MINIFFRHVGSSQFDFEKGLDNGYYLWRGVKGMWRGVKGRRIRARRVYRHAPTISIPFHFIQPTTHPHHFLYFILTFLPHIFLNLISDPSSIKSINNVSEIW